MKGPQRSGFNGRVRKIVVTTRDPNSNEFTSETEFGDDGFLLGWPRPQAEAAQPIVGVDAWSPPEWSQLGVPWIGFGVSGSSTAQSSLDSTGKPQRSDIPTQNGDLMSWLEYLYDAEGRLVQVVQFNGTVPLDQRFPLVTPELMQIPFYAVAGHEQMRVRYTYEGTTRLVQDMEGFGGVLKQRTVHDYNEHGDEVWRQLDDEPPVTTEYEYDSAGNWITKIAGTIEERRGITYNE